MKIKEGKVKDFKHFVEINSNDGYSYGVVKYMHRWADLMEAEMAYRKGYRQSRANTVRKVYAMILKISSEISSFLFMR